MIASCGLQDLANCIRNSVFGTAYSSWRQDILLSESNLYIASETQAYSSKLDIEL